MNKKAALFTLCILSALCIFAAAGLQTAAMFLSYEPEAHYFASGEILPAVAIACAIISALCGIVFAFLCPQSELSASPFSTALLPSIPAAIGCGICGIAFLCAPGSIGKIGGLMLIAAAAGCVLCGSSLRTAHPNLVSLLAFAPVIGCAAINAYYYFDISIEMNAPVKVVLQTALLFSMLYFTAEIRYLIGRARPRLYLILAFCTLSACSLGAVPFPVAYVAKCLTRLDYIMGALLTLGIAVTVIFRLFALLRPLFVTAQEPIPETAPTDPADSAQDGGMNE